MQQPQAKELLSINIDRTASHATWVVAGHVGEPVVMNAARVVPAGERDFAELSPAFLWLLRDFHLSLTDEQGRKVGARQDHSLRP
jgi:hypothetical protein